MRAKTVLFCALAVLLLALGVPVQAAAPPAANGAGGLVPGAGQWGAAGQRLALLKNGTSWCVPLPAGCPVRLQTQGQHVELLLNGRRLRLSGGPASVPFLPAA